MFILDLKENWAKPTTTFCNADNKLNTCRYYYGHGYNYVVGTANSGSSV